MPEEKKRPSGRHPSQLSTASQKRNGDPARPKLIRSTSTLSSQTAKPVNSAQKQKSCSIADWATVSYSSALHPMQHGEVDPFNCQCRHCQRFWRKAFGTENAALLSESTANRSRMTGPMFYVKDLEVKVGDRVLVWRTHQGIVKYIGPLADDFVSPHLYIGVQLDDNINSLTNGVYKEKRYFYCPPGHGAFVKYKDVIVSPPADKVPKVKGNEMFPSYKAIVTERRQRREIDPEYDIGTTLREERAKTPDLKQALSTSRKIGFNDYVYDPQDTAYKDYIRHVNRPPPKRHTEVKLTDHERKLLELKKEFGGGSRADRMVETVQKLHQAYKDGLEVRAEETTYDE